MHALWSQAKVRNDRNLSLDQTIRRGRTRTLHLDRFRAGLLDKADRIADCLYLVRVISPEGHVRDQQRAAHPPSRGASVVQHLFKCARQS